MIDRQLLALLDALADELPDEAGLELVVVGGTALVLQGLVRRATRDVDVLGALEEGVVVPLDPVPAHLRDAIADVAALFGVSRTWLNTGPASQLEDGLPPGFVSRLVEFRRRPGLRVWLAGRLDLIWMKLYAAADSYPAANRHIQDLVSLHPSARELADAAAWVRTLDTSPGFAQNLDATLVLAESA